MYTCLRSYDLLNEQIICADAANDYYIRFFSLTAMLVKLFQGQECENYSGALNGVLTPKEIEVPATSPTQAKAPGMQQNKVGDK